MILFHTPKLPKPLNIDLTQLTGGGACPSQFYGQTHDGRDVYVRYRGGVLRVHVADVPGKNAYNSPPNLEIEVGPVLDGSLSLSGFCRYFGVTVNGQIPAETDPEAYRYADLSGQSTFWDANFEHVTDETSRKILAACLDTIPGALLIQADFNDRYEIERLIEVNPDEIKGHSIHLVVGSFSPKEIATGPLNEFLLKEGQWEIIANFPLWQFPEPRYTSHGQVAASKELGRDLIEVGMRGMPKGAELAVSYLTLAATFPTSQKTIRTVLSRLGELLASLLPQTKLENVDLSNGKVISEREEPLDPAIARWCSMGEDRWLKICKDGRKSPWIGVRPA
jgi:hypothetical protein